VGPGPLVAVAVHEGSEVRPSLRPSLSLTAEERRREEDPGTGEWARLVPTRLVARRSRFEVDLNRPPERAVYLRPEEAWGLSVWRAEPSATELSASRAIHARFFARLAEILDRKVAEAGGFVLLDLHSYNHRRGGPGAPAADPATNPEVNVGTGSLDRSRFGGLVDRFIADLRSQRAIPLLDVRENVRFRGGWVAEWTNSRYGERGAALAIEFKKTYLDEWSGALDAERASRLGEALRATFRGLEESLRAHLASATGSPRR